MGGGLADDVKRLSPPLDLWRSFVYCESLFGDVFGTVDHFKVLSFPITVPPNESLPFIFSDEDMHGAMPSDDYNQFPYDSQLRLQNNSYMISIALVVLCSKGTERCNVMTSTFVTSWSR